MISFYCVVRSSLVLAIVSSTACRRNDPPTTTAGASQPPAAAASTDVVDDEPADPPAFDVGAPVEDDEPQPPPADPPARRPEPSPGDVDAVRGLTQQALLDRWGEPDDKKAKTWIYRLPRDAGCVERYVVFTVVFAGGKVERVDMTRERTADHCAPTF
jgi:hypothetical protein